MRSSIGSFEQWQKLAGFYKIENVFITIEEYIKKKPVDMYNAFQKGRTLAKIWISKTGMCFLALMVSPMEYIVTNP